MLTYHGIGDWALFPPTIRESEHGIGDWALFPPTIRESEFFVIHAGICAHFWSIQKIKLFSASVWGYTVLVNYVLK